MSLIKKQVQELEEAKTRLLDNTKSPLRRKFIKEEANKLIQSLIKLIIIKPQQNN